MAKTDLGKIVRKKRKALKLTQKELAEQLPISNQYLSEIENGKTLPSVDVLILLAQKLGTSIDALLADDMIDAEREKMDHILRSNTPEDRELIMEILLLVSRNLAKREKSLDKHNED